MGMMLFQLLHVIGKLYRANANTTLCHRVGGELAIR